jgi:hypothetical protein
VRSWRSRHDTHTDTVTGYVAAICGNLRPFAETKEQIGGFDILD